MFSVLPRYKGRLDTAGIQTAFYEVMLSGKSRPLTVEHLNDHSSTVITPNHLVTMKPHQLRALPGEFGDQETYGKLMWKKVQAFANQFWREWKATYLKDITKRQRWEQKDRNVAKGDLVLLIDENQPRNLWKMAIVEEALEVYPKTGASPASGG